uniref:Reverse transcriptase domain-containing protein n=1 Tax=Tanacetum cinerariifolium TaxID=118510 RepID=A0A6L2P1N9_TANCI|nr:hypothetical protein [Tanacetum cinerariifolium]
MPKYAKILKGLLTNRARLEEACTITMNERCSAVLLNKFPSKEKDPSSFTIPCDIGELHINNALADLGASISLMPYTMYEKLGLGELKATRMSLELADRSIQYPRGIVENVLIKFDKFILPIDYIILDIPEDSRVPIILGRPFLATARAMIDVFNKIIMLKVGDDEVIFDMDQSIKRSPAKDDECYGVDDLVDAINTEDQEILANDMSALFLLKGLEKSIDQSELESCESFECKAIDDSDLGELIRRIEYIKHKAYCALKQSNMDLTAAAKNHFMELNELMELRDGAYKNTRIYKERTKRWHDSRLRGDKNFKVGDKSPPSTSPPSASPSPSPSRKRSRSPSPPQLPFPSSLPSDMLPPRKRFRMTPLQTEATEETTNETLTETTTPFIFPRLIRHEGLFEEIHDHLRKVSLERINTLELEVETLCDRVEIAEHRTDNLQDALRRARDEIVEHQVHHEATEPHNFKETEGVVGLTRWFEKMMSVFYINSYAKNCQKEKVITYAYRLLKTHEKNYTTYDLELGVLVFTLKI